MGAVLFTLFKGNAAIIVVTLVAFASGWYLSDVFHKAETAKRVQAEIVNLSAQYEHELKSSRRELQVASETVTRLSKQYENINKKKLTATKEIVKYVKTNDNCNVSRGAVRLLNNARRFDSETTLPETTSNADEKGRAASSVTQRDEIEAHINCATQYSKLAARNNALIDYIEGSDNGG